MALKTNQMGVLYFNDTVPLGAMLEEGGAIEGQVIKGEKQRTREVRGCTQTGRWHEALPAGKPHSTEAACHEHVMSSVSVSACNEQCVCVRMS